MQNIITAGITAVVLSQGLAAPLDGSSPYFGGIKSLKPRNDSSLPCTSNASRIGTRRPRSYCARAIADAIKSKKRTLANLSAWPAAKIEALRCSRADKPDAGNRHVRFDERDVETQSWSNR